MFPTFSTSGSQPGTALSPRGKCQEIFFVVTTGGGVVLASSGQSPGMSLNVLQCMEQLPPHTKKCYLAKIVSSAQVEKPHFISVLLK